MPDWTYHTVFRPPLFAIGAKQGRRLAFGCMRLLARLPLGTRVIQLMGHMRPDERLSIECAGRTLRSPIGLGHLLDPELWATRAFAEFGFGFLEIGPVTTDPPSSPGPVRIDSEQQSLRLDTPLQSLSVAETVQRLGQLAPLPIPIFARVEPSSKNDATEILEQLAPHVDGVVVPIEHLDSVGQLADLEAAAGSRRLLGFAALDAAAWQRPEVQQKCRECIEAGRLNGLIVVAAPGSEHEQVLGASGRDDSVQAIREMRRRLGPAVMLIGSVGVHTPADALDMLAAGADAVQVDSGLVFSGPGLPKRINEAVLFYQVERARAAAEDAESGDRVRLGGAAWFWAALMGLSMFVGGLLAMAIATTRVVLPYDESIAGLTRDELIAINDRLLHFMTHDRVTLAGTMLAVGIQYLALAWWGIRRGLHWAWVTIIASAGAGFCSFFSFLGFGYFDPFHAFVTAVLFQFLLLTVHSRVAPCHPTEWPNLFNDRRWRMNQWGQSLFVLHGAILIVAGGVILSIGMTSVFVPEDLHFMQTTADDLHGAHPQLVPLVAHDRATFGGMLIACGVATLLPAIWGFQRGQAWLWWALMLAGNVAYVSTIAVHWTVGYDSLKHLLPAYGGLALLWTGGLLSYRYLVARDRALEAEWQRRLQAT